MRLAEFIRSSMDAILQQWEVFAAAQLPAAARMSRTSLRDHARQILLAVAADIGQPQSRADQELKSKGGLLPKAGVADTAAEVHAQLRARSGFNINQMAAEYRALRASVLRLWADESRPAASDLGDTIRFNEAIDQALAESIAHFNAEVEQSRNLLLGVLGHDMRNPLQAIQMSAELLRLVDASATVKQAAGRILGSSARLKSLLDDLLDFSRTRMGLSIDIVRAPTDLARVCAAELEVLRAAHPGRVIELQVDGDVTGNWDAARLHQVLGNLVSNALKYGSPDTPIEVQLVGTNTTAWCSVRNRGPGIAAAELDLIFDPLTRGAAQVERSERSSSVGLGLYICREIATAHGGTIEVRSTAGTTEFRVSLPRAGE